MAFTTKIKQLSNLGLGLVGLELSTTRRQRAETLRLKELVARGHWSAPHFGKGLCLDDGKFLKFLTEVCVPYRGQYTGWQDNGEASHDSFFVSNGWFQSVDAEMLYCLIRHAKPKRIVEVGCGFSTRLMRRAIADGNLATRLKSIDPNPRVEIEKYTDEVVKQLVEELEPSELAGSLNANDILFIDSSHTVTTGGDVPYLLLEVIPRLRTGVLIHIHDIFLPCEYPKEWVVDSRWGWNEQYLVHAFLYNNFAYEIIWLAHYMWTDHRGEVLKIIACDPARTSPSSLWLKKVGDDVNA